MIRHLYHTLVDLFTGKLRLVTKGYSPTVGHEIGPFIQDVMLVDRQGNELRLTSDGSLASATRDSQTKTGVWDQLTAAGTTDAIWVRGYTEHTIAVTIAAIDTSVDVRIEGKIGGADWFNLDDSNADTQFGTDGTYQFHAERTIDEIRFNFVTEAGGANATLNPAYAGLP